MTDPFRILEENGLQQWLRQGLLGCTIRSLRLQDEAFLTLPPRVLAFLSWQACFIHPYFPSLE